MKNQKSNCAPSKGKPMPKGKSAPAAKKSKGVPDKAVKSDRGNFKFKSNHQND